MCVTFSWPIGWGGGYCSRLSAIKTPEQELKSSLVGEGIHMPKGWCSPMPGDRSTCPLHHFIWVLYNVLHDKLVNVSKRSPGAALASWTWGDSLGNIQFIAHWWGAQVTICTCNWPLKRQQSMEQALNLGDLMLSPGRMEFIASWY